MEYRTMNASIKLKVIFCAFFHETIYFSGAVATAYFADDFDLFEIWWNTDGRISRGGQQRKQRSINKKDPM